jgi:eukaryotic-like serine/threonine-protein kinase
MELTLNIGLPKLIDNGKTATKYFIVMDLFDGEASDLRIRFTSARSVNNIMELGKRVVRSLQIIHEQGFVHSDVKPSNILYKFNEEREYSDYTLVDFGISSKFKDTNDNHIDRSCNHHFEGSIEFMGTECLHNMRPTRKHDFESLFYSLLYLLKGECAYGQLDQTFITTKLRSKHQILKRESFQSIASKMGISLSEYL